MQVKFHQEMDIKPIMMIWLNIRLEKMFDWSIVKVVFVNVITSKELSKKEKSW